MIHTHVSVMSERLGVAAMALLGLSALYVLALDQGWLLSLVQGASALDMNVLHEFVHDARHTAGFPCH